MIHKIIFRNILWVLAGVLVLTGQAWGQDSPQIIGPIEVCAGAVVEYTVSGGTEPYTWSVNGTIDNSTTSNVLSVTWNTEEKNNIVSVSYNDEESNPTGYLTVTILAVPTSPSISVTDGNINICGNNTVTLTASGTGSLNWYKNGTDTGETDTSLTLDKEKKGIYTVTTTENECVSAQSAPVEIKDITPIKPTLTMTGSFCNGMGTVTLTANDGASGTYQWEKDGSIISGNSSILSLTSVSEIGDYSVKAVNSGCTSEASDAVTVKNVTTVKPSLAMTGSFCNGTGTVTLTANGGASGTYQWEKDGSIISGNSSILSLTSVSEIGDYSVKAVNSGCISEASDAVTVKNVTTAKPSLTMTGSFCNGTGTMTLTANGGASGTYQWEKDGSIISGNSSILSLTSVSEIGDYSVKAVNSGCISEASDAVTVKNVNTAKPSLTMTGSFCNGTGTVTLTANGGASGTYQWEKSGGEAISETSSTLNLSTSQTGVYTVKAVNGVCMSEASEAVTVSETSTAKPSLTMTGSFCNGTGTVTLTANSGAPGTYQWVKDGGVVIGETSFTLNLSASQTGVYTVKTVNGSCTSEASNAVTVSETSTAKPSLTMTGSFCNGTGTVILTANSGVPGTYQWVKDGGVVIGETSFTLNLSASQTGVYTVKTVNGSCTSEASNAVTVSETSAAKPTLAMTGSFCNGVGTVTLTANSGALGTYQWVKDGGVVIGETSSTLNLSASQTGVYTVKAVNGSCTSEASNAVTVSETSAAKPTLARTGSFCNGVGTVTLTANSGAPGTYQWVKDGGVVIGETSFTLNLSASQTGVYTVKTVNGSCTSEASNAVTVENVIVVTPTITNQNSSTTICSSGSVNLKASGNGTYTWYKNNVEVGGSLTNTFTESLSQIGEYSYKVKATFNNCSSTISDPILITVKKKILVNPLISQTTVGADYSDRISVSNVDAADMSILNYHLVPDPALPGGITFNKGEFSGIPEKKGTFTGNITVSNDKYCPGIGIYSITVDCSSINFPVTPMPDGTYNQSYTQTITPATSPNVTFSYTQSGTLPTGLSFNNSTLTISGIPTVVGKEFPFSIIARDSKNAECMAPQSYTIEIKCGTITIGNLATTEVNLESPMPATILSASGGKSPYQFTLETAPNWLSLSGNKLSGTPTGKTGTYPVAISVIDANGCIGSRDYDINVGCGTIILPATTLSNGNVGKAYNSQISPATRGGGTYQFSYVLDASTQLPAGLRFDPANRSISGIPVSKGTSEFRIIAADVNSPECKVTQTYNITVACGEIRLGAINTSASYNVAYSASLTASGGVGEYSYSLKNGSSLPVGLSLSTSGVISGTPTGNSSTFTVVATDGQGCTGENTYTITVGCASGTILPATLPSGVYGTDYSQQFTVTPNTNEDRFTLNGSVQGLSLRPDGLLSGKPAQSGTFSISVTVTDANSCSSSKIYTLLINKAEVTVSPDANQSKKYKETVPTLTYQLSGLKFPTDETSVRQAINLTTSATTDSPVGSYDIALPSNTSHNNYIIKMVNNPNKLSVTKANQTIDFQIITHRTYGDGTFDLTANASSGNNITYTSSDPNVAVITGKTVTIRNAGETTIEASVTSGDPNYNDATPKTQKLTVNKATLFVRANNASREYGDLNPTFTYTCTGWKNNDDISKLDPKPVATSVAGLNNNVGDYPIGFLTGAEDKNYKYTVTNGSLTITKAPLTLRATNITAPNTNNPGYAYTCTGIKNGEAQSSVITTQPTFSLTKISDSEYTIVISGGGCNNNYEIKNRFNGTLTVTGKPIVTVKVSNASMTYGDTGVPSFSLSYSGFETGDNESKLDSKPTVVTAGITSRTPAGQHSVIASGGVDSKYEFKYEPGILTVAKASLTATVANAQKTYGQPDPEFTFNYVGWKNNESESVLTTKPKAGRVSGSDQNAGNHNIRITACGTAANYEMTCSDAVGILTILPAEQYIEGFDPLESKTYKDNPFDLPGPEKTTAGLTITYSSSNTAVATISGRRVTIVGVGYTDITASQAGTNNYKAAQSVTQRLTVGKVEQTIVNFTLERDEITYGTKSTLTVSANTRIGSTLNTPGLPVTFASSDPSIASVSGNTITIHKAGLVTITASQGGDDNYKAATSVNKTLTINKAEPNIQFSPFSQAITYGGAPVLITATVTPSGLPLTYSSNNENIAKIEGGFVNIINSGSANITVSCSGNENYAPAHVTQTFNVQKAKLTVKADDKRRQKGKINPPFTATYSGFVNGENTSVLSGNLTFECAADINSNVGSYEIKVSGVQAVNYNIVFEKGLLTITDKAVLQVSAKSASREYGSANPAFTLEYSGFESGDTEASLATRPKISCDAKTDSKAGSYPITVSGGQDTKYDFSYTHGTLTVTKAMLTVTADNKKRYYGQENPELTVTYSGFKLDQDETVLDQKPVATTEAVPASDVKDWPITVSGGFDDCYDFTYVNGNLTIAATLSIGEMSNIYYGDKPFVIPIVAEGGITLPEVTASIISGEGVVTISRNESDGQWFATIQSAGVTDIRAIFSGDDARIGASATARLEVKKATLTAQAKDYERKQGERNPDQWEITYSGFVYNDNIYDIERLPVASCTASPASLIGSYPITVSGGSDNNYVFEYQPGTLQVLASEYLPTAFTPNGDGINDIFAHGYKIKIFNRLGVLLFNGDNGWDGTYKGRVVEPGVYFYISTTPQGLEQKGTVEIIKTK